MFFHAKGMIALDIDGTLTDKTLELAPSVISALHHLAQDGWLFIFITGRPFQWACRPLESLPFAYALAVQNGALLVEMPSRKILSRKYLTQEILSSVERISQEHHTDFVVYAGLEHEDWCYYRPSHLPSEILAYVSQRTTFLGEKWQGLATFSDLPISFFPSIKFFAKEEGALRLSQSLENQLGLHAPPNRDPFNPEYFVIQATHREATKGEVLSEFIRLTHLSGPVIAAGDDYNDHSMLQVAHVKVVMPHAPAALLEMADIIAPPVDQQGIIQGLAEAIRHLTQRQGKTCV